MNDQPDDFDQLVNNGMLDVLAKHLKELEKELLIRQKKFAQLKKTKKTFYQMLEKGLTTLQENIRYTRELLYLEEVQSSLPIMRNIKKNIKAMSVHLQTLDLIIQKLNRKYFWQFILLIGLGLAMMIWFFMCKGK